MSSDQEQKQQELPAWKSEEVHMAGAQGGQGNGYEPTAGRKIGARGGCCSNMIKKCGCIGSYFSPLFDKLGYSLLTSFYHWVMFAYTLAVMIIVITLWSVSVGLLILIFGFILYWWTCEISVFLARIDLALAYYMVEDNEELIATRGQSLQLSLYKEIAPCPCSSTSKCCDATMTRMKSVALRCDTLRILLSQALFKPLIVFTTCWIAIVVIYTLASIFAPVVYVVSPHLFLKRYLCPFGAQSCDDGECKCYVFSIDNFGGALLYGFIAFLIAPFVLHVNIWFAKASKGMSYFWLTDYYSKNKDEQRGNLLAIKPNNAPVRDNSVSVEPHNPTKTGIVHSLNNPYVDPQV